MNPVFLFICAIILSFIFNRTLGQENLLSGRVVDEATSVPLEFATVSFRNTTSGTTTNKEGKFVVAVRDTDMKDSLIISYLGYQSTRYSVDDFLKQGLSIDILLKPELKEIGTVTVLSKTIPEILSAAVERTDALIAEAGLLDAYYREFASLDNELFKFADASLIYLVEAGKQKSKVETYIEESRIVKDSISRDEKWKSDVESLIDADKAVKQFYRLNYLRKFTGKNHLNYFDFSMDDKGQYSIITVNPKSTLKQYLPTTVVYIDKESEQIVRAD